MQPTLHFDGPVWRPPYEATSQLLQVTAGCTGIAASSAHSMASRSFVCLRCRK